MFQVFLKIFIFVENSPLLPLRGDSKIDFFENGVFIVQSFADLLLIALWKLWNFIPLAQ
jgi:hypothetical protein